MPPSGKETILGLFLKQVLEKSSWSETEKGKKKGQVCLVVIPGRGKMLFDDDKKVFLESRGWNTIQILLQRDYLFRL